MIPAAISSRSLASSRPGPSSAPGSARPAASGTGSPASARARRTRSATCANWSGAPLADPPAPDAVDEHEEGRTGHLVLAPGLGRHDDRAAPAAPSERTSACISSSGPLVTTTIRTPSPARADPAGASRPKSPAHVAHPDDRKASSVSPPADAGAIASASPLGVTPADGGRRRRIALARKRRAHGDRHRKPLPAPDPAVRPSLRLASGPPASDGSPDADAEIVQRLQDVGMAAQQSGHQHREEQRPRHTARGRERPQHTSGSRASGDAPASAPLAGAMLREPSSRVRASPGAP